MAWPWQREARASQSLEVPGVAISNANVVQILGWGSASAAGITVTREVAMRVPAFRAAVLFLSWTIASLPLDLFRRTKEGRDTASNDPLYSILHDAPNDETTSFDFRRWLISAALTEGRGLAFIERNGAGRVMNLWPLETCKMTVSRVNGRKVYTYKDASKEYRYDASEIIDLVWMHKPDGLGHDNPIDQVKDVIGLSTALTNYASKFFENGGVPPLVLQGPITSPGAAARAKTDVEAAVRAANGDKRNVLVMPSGHELKPVGFDPDKGQMTEAQRFQIEQIARFFNLSPIFLQDLTHGTFSNTEQQDLHVVKHTISQWASLIEQELNLKLFSLRNRKNFVEFNLDGLLRGDFLSRMSGYSTAIQNGINTPQEVRRMENWPDRPDADVLLVQGAMVPIGDAGKQAEPMPAPAAKTNQGEPK